MSDQSQGPGWWLASDGRWYPPREHPDAGLPPPVVQPDAAPGTPARRRGRIVVPLLVAAVLVAGGGFLAWSFLSGNGGGAANPEAAVEEFVASVDDGDLLGLLAGVDPTEAEIVSGLFEALSDVGSAQAGLVFDDGRLLDGVDLAMGAIGGGELELEVRPRADTDDVAEVRVASLQLTLTRTEAAAQAVALVGSDLPAAWSTGEFAPGAEVTFELTARGRTTDLAVVMEGQRWEAEGVPFTLGLTTVRRDGRWYVSPSGTAAELVVDALDLDPLDFERGQLVRDDDGAGGDDAVDAVERLAATAFDYDVDGALQLVDPVDDRLLHALWGAMEDPVRADRLDDVDPRDRTRVSDLGLVRADADGQTRVSVEQLELTWDRGRDPDDEVTISLDGWCLVARAGDDRPERLCLDDLVAAVPFPPGVAFDGLPEVEELLAPAPYLVVQSRGGRSFVSPLATAAAWVDDLAEELGDDGELPDGAEGSRWLTAVPAGPGDTVSVVVDDTPVVVAVSVPPGDPRDLSGLGLEPTGDEAAAIGCDRAFGGAADRARCVVASTDFVVVTVEASEPVIMGLGSNNASPVEATVLRGVLHFTQPFDRTLPVTVHEGSADLTVTVERVEPLLFTAAGAYTVEPAAGSIAVAVLASDDDATANLEGATVQTRRLRDAGSVGVSESETSFVTFSDLTVLVFDIAGESAELQIAGAALSADDVTEALVVAGAIRDDIGSVTEIDALWACSGMEVDEVVFSQIGADFLDVAVLPAGQDPAAFVRYLEDPGSEPCRSADVDYVLGEVTPDPFGHVFEVQVTIDGDPFGPFEDFTGATRNVVIWSSNRDLALTFLEAL